MHNHNLLSPDAINAPLLERVSAHIAAHPDSIYMGFWGNGPITYDKTGESRFTKGACACIGTWAVALSEGHVNPENWGVGAKAREVLWLDEEQAANLFYDTNWPAHFYRRLRVARTRDEYAGVVRERIAAFINSGGRDGVTRAEREGFTFSNGASVGIGGSREVGTRPLTPEAFERLEEMITAALGVSSNIWPIDNDHRPNGLIAQIRERHQQQQVGRQYRLPESGHTYHPLTGEEGSHTGFSISGNTRENTRLGQGQRLMILDDPTNTRLTPEETRAVADFWLRDPAIRRPGATERVTRAFNSLNPCVPPVRNEVLPLIEYAAALGTEVLRPNGGIGLTGPDTTHYLHREQPSHSAQIAIDWGADGRASRGALLRSLYEGTFLPTQQSVLEPAPEVCDAGN